MIFETKVNKTGILKIISFVNLTVSLLLSHYHITIKVPTI